ncbi:hypothetical protein AXF42_Ash007551 [Apostasia shenzhenica]|uniref:Mal d 1-associated protein n=1 Tax=Apostasia shenzhenica TaxID=1088818 RepID=A0A2I0A5T9_9ASPA|nr:hypothetical protein AXF42_Ash007551 [Apostasia shenzhenica]
MGWWTTADSSPESFAGGAGGEEEANCTTRRISKSSCTTEEVEPGRFVRKCEKTEEILRACVGRSPEVVESKTEHTEDDVTDEMMRGMLPTYSGTDAFTFPGLRSDLESIEQEMLGGFSNFMESAEKITNEFLNSFNIPSIQKPRWPPLERRRSPDWQPESNESKEMAEPAYTELGGEIKDV